MQLWCFCALYRPKGNLDGLDATEIEKIIGWEGEQGLLVATLERVGFLERDSETGTLSLHGWEEHNPWLFYSEERREIARKAAFAK